MISRWVAILLICAAHQTLAQSEGPKRQLNEREIHALLKDGTLIRAVPCTPNAPLPQEELIRADGSYTAFDDRADLHGTTFVRARMLCIEVRGRHQCRKILKNDKDNYWQEQTYHPDTRTWSRQIEFLPVKTPLNCAK